MAENNSNIPEITPEEEAKLARMAARRTSFKIHLAIFILANAFLWVVWYFLFKGKEDITFLKAILFLLIVWYLNCFIVNLVFVFEVCVKVLVAASAYGKYHYIVLVELHFG